MNRFRRIRLYERGPCCQDSQALRDAKDGREVVDVSATYNASAHLCEWTLVVKAEE
jgi:hypothetical protein